MITLRPVEASDVDVFFDHQADPVAAEMAASPVRDRATHEQHFFGQVLTNPTGMIRTVLVDGVVAGNVVSWQSDGQRLLGYRFGRSFWGRGVATAAVSAYLAEVRERPIHAFVAAHNIGSQRVLEKNGFVKESTEAHVGPDGIGEFLYVLN